MKFNYFVMLSFMLTSSAFAMNVTSWKKGSPPGVFIVGDAAHCRQAICVGATYNEMVGLTGSTPVYGSAICLAQGNDIDGFSCPPANECVEEESSKIKPAVLKAVMSQKKPVVIDETGGWNVLPNTHSH